MPTIDGEKLPDGPGGRTGIRGPKLLPPNNVADVLRCFGPDLWDRMDLDPVVYSSTSRLATAALVGGVHALPAIQPPEGQDPDRRAKKAAEIATFIQGMFDNLERPLPDVLHEMMRSAWRHGNKLAELVEHRDTVDGKITLKEIASKPHWSWRLAVDGLGKPLGVTPAGTFDPAKIWPLDGFMLLSWDTRDGDVRGNSMYQHIYRPWNYRSQLYPEHFAYQGRFASPSVSVEIDAAMTGQTVPEYNAAGDLTGNAIPLELACYRAVLGWKNAYALVLPPGCKAVMHEATGNGEAFIRGQDGYKDEITQGVLHTARAVMKSDRNSQADAGAAKDTEGDLIEWLGEWCAKPLARVARRYTELNYGAAAARDLTPIIRVGEMATKDVPAEMGVAGSLGFKLHPSQFPGLDQRWGLPRRAEGWDQGAEPSGAWPYD